MFKYTSQKQLSIFDFHTDFESKLNADNRWVKMAKILDWDKLAAVYAKSFSTTMGASSIDARIVIGALINESPRRKRSGYHDGLQILLFAASGGEFNPKRLNI